jgi:hypothetical protein
VLYKEERSKLIEIAEVELAESQPYDIIVNEIGEKKSLKACEFSDLNVPIMAEMG